MKAIQDCTGICLQSNQLYWTRCWTKGLFTWNIKVKYIVEVGIAAILDNHNIFLRISAVINSIGTQFSGNICQLPLILFRWLYTICIIYHTTHNQDSSLLHQISPDKVDLSLVHLFKKKIRWLTFFKKEFYWGDKDKLGLNIIINSKLNSDKWNYHINSVFQGNQSFKSTLPLNYF